MITMGIENGSIKTPEVNTIPVDHLVDSYDCDSFNRKQSFPYSKNVIQVCLMRHCYNLILPCMIHRQMEAQQWLFG